ncbi:MAG: formylglycine-generating enzyme family protein [Candidatus Poribacteria bacterium]|nr:formylglycine-generating enzyme family protein [Candidatus Poribacteria bacterium]
MSKRDEFIAFIDDLKSVSATITEEQRKGLLRRAVQQHDLSAADAVDILRASGLVIGEKENYFEVLGFSIEDLQNQNESTITSQVDAAHQKLYRESLNAGGRVRPDGKSEEQWRAFLNQARDTLKDGQKRQAHNAMLQNDVLPPIGSFSEAAFIDPKTEKPPSRTSEQDSMVLIPAGDFQMGSDDYDANIDEKPAHTVYVDAFYMDKYPVTNAQYKEFLDANPQWRNLGLFDYHLIFRKYRDTDYLKNWFKGKYPTGKADHPVNWVSWHAAMAYAKWVGKRLPTEAEWEKAARGGVEGQKYPWGNAIYARNANFDQRVGETTSVGKYPPNGYGLCDIVGNVAEWCLDEWNIRFYQLSESRNPVSGGSIDSIINTLTKQKKPRVIRGGSWHSAEHEVRVSNRDRLAPWKTNSLIGFRCVKPVSS